MRDTPRKGMSPDQSKNQLLRVTFKLRAEGDLRREEILERRKLEQGPQTGLESLGSWKLREEDTSLRSMESTGQAIQNSDANRHQSFN